MKQNTDKCATWYVVCLCAFLGLLFIKGYIVLVGLPSWASGGIPSHALEQDARNACEVPDSFIAVRDDGKDLSALLFFSKEPNESNETFLYVYVRQPGENKYDERLLRDTYSRDYMFQVQAQELEDDKDQREYILASNNDLGVSLVEIITENGVCLRNVNPKEPFVLVIPHDYEAVYYCDENVHRIQTIDK